VQDYGVNNEVENKEERYLQNYPIIAITGDFGSGKTLLATFMALSYKHKEDLNIFANYQFNKVKYKQVTFEEVSKMPSWLKNGVLVLDEMQIGADSYNFMNKEVQKMTTFITQIRKRDIILIVTTQRFNMISKRIRLLINYYIEVESKKKGYVTAKTFDITGGFENLLNIRTHDLRKVYPYYDTREVIRNEKSSNE